MFTSSRLVAYNQNQQTRAKYNRGCTSTKYQLSADRPTIVPGTEYDLELPKFASSPTAGAGSINSFGPSSNLAGIAAPQSKSPESDSFAYMEIFSTKESLAVLGKLGALNAIGQRFPQEIYVLVESTLDEVFR